MEDLEWNWQTEGFYMFRNQRQLDGTDYLDNGGERYVRKII